MSSDSSGSLTRRSYLSASGVAMTGLLSVLAGCMGGSESAPAPSSPDVHQTTDPNSTGTMPPGSTGGDLYSGTFTETPNKTTHTQPYFQSQPTSTRERPNGQPTSTPRQTNSTPSTAQSVNNSENGPTTLTITSGGSYDIIVDDPEAKLVEGDSQIEITHGSGCQSAFSRLKSDMKQRSSHVVSFTGSIASVQVSGKNTVLEADLNPSQIDAQSGVAGIGGDGTYSFTMTGKISDMDNSTEIGEIISSNSRSVSGVVSGPVNKHVDEFNAGGRIKKVVLTPRNDGLRFDHEYDSRPCDDPAGT